MSLPFATTTIAVLRSTSADTDDSDADPDGYPDAEPGWTVVEDGIRAVISAPGGTFVQGGSLQAVTGYRLACDVCDVTHADRVRDEHTGTVYVIEWVHQGRGFGLDHMSAAIRLVEGMHG